MVEMAMMMLLMMMMLFCCLAVCCFSFLLFQFDYMKSIASNVCGTYGAEREQRAMDTTCRLLNDTNSKIHVWSDETWRGNLANKKQHFIATANAECTKRRVLNSSSGNNNNSSTPHQQRALKHTHTHMHTPINQTKRNIHRDIRHGTYAAVSVRLKQILSPIRTRAHTPLCHW